MVCRNRCRGRMLAAGIFSIAIVCRGGVVQSAENEQRIREALAKPTQMEFTDSDFDALRELLLRGSA